ncbi:hypothetical protein [Actinomadura keratinilytica]|uniref:hypothetical protein n=1 Tax=Actinomadura keratinilytica TaxID=547461 RepID=UPI0031F15CFF
MSVFFDEVGPELYRENAFRITGLPVDATARDIRRRSEELRLKERLGVSQGSGAAVLPLSPPPDATVTDQAMQRLRDPARRLEDEFFWFWPSRDGGPDEALAALRRGDADTAERLWRESSADPATAAHNLAVLAHVRALDRAAGQEHGGGLDPDGRALWERAFAYWSRVVADPAVWTRVDTRVAQIADPRLTLETTTRMRSRLPAALLSINARLAVRAARDGRHDDAAAQVALMRRSGFATATVMDVLARAVEPETARLHSLGENAERTVDAAPDRGAEVTARFLEQAASLLGTLRVLLDEGDPAVQGAGDEIASRVLRCLVPYARATDDWQTTVGLLEQALPLAATESVRTRIEENLAAARSNLLFATCWFCRVNPTHQPSTHEQKMWGDLRTEYVGPYIRYNWQRIAIGVPRCASCAARHRRTIMAGRWVSLALLAASVLALAVLDGGLAIAVILFGACVLAWFGSRPRHGLPRGALQQVMAFDPVRERLSAGWLLGDRQGGGQV